jgi:RNA polymerase sigma-70 factor (ECF subfamily)
MAGKHDDHLAHSADARIDFATLWAESYERIRAYVRISIPSLHDSDDVIQETAMAIAKDIDRYDPSRPFLDWAIGIARHRILQFYRKRGRDRRMIFDVDTLMAIEQGFLAAEPKFNDYQEALQVCIDHLPKRAKKIVELRYLNCLNAEQIAHSLGFRVQSVYTRLSQIRQGLRECIQRRLSLSGDAK